MDRSADELYGLPLKEFISARNELSKRLKAEGNETGAAALRKLSKPSLSTWAVNQAARQNPKRIKELISASDRLRAAHSKGGADLREATRLRNSLVARLAEEAGRILEESGHSASRTQLDKVTATLQAASSSDEHHDDLRAGRMTGDLQPSGFGELAGWEPPEPSGRVTRMESPQLRKARREAEDMAARAESAEERAETVAELAEQQRRRAEGAVADAKEARAAARAARKRADAAAAKLSQLERTK